MSTPRSDLSGLQLEKLYTELFSAINAIHNACVGGDLSSFFANDDGVKKLNAEARRINALRETAKSDSADADIYNAQSAQRLVQALEKMVQEKSEKFKEGEDSSLFVANINANQNKEHAFRLAALLLQQLRVSLKDSPISFDLSIQDYYAGVEPASGKNLSTYHSIASKLHDPKNTPVHAVPMDPHEKFFNDLYASIVALSSAYQTLHEDTIFPRRSSDLEKLRNAAYGIQSELGSELRIVRDNHQDAEVIACYDKGSAHLLFLLRQHLSDRIQGDATLVAKLNQMAQQNDHHALRLAGLLFKKAYLAAPKGVLMPPDMLKSSEVEKNLLSDEMKEMAQVSYLASNVLRELSDENVINKKAYNFVLDRLQVPPKVQPVIAATVSNNAEQPSLAQTKSDVSKGKPSRASRYSQFARQPSPVDIAKDAQPITSGLGKPPRA